MRVARTPVPIRRARASGFSGMIDDVGMIDDRELEASWTPPAAPVVDPLARHRAWSQVQRGLFARITAPIRLGRYLLVEQVGAGANGIVYAAYDPELDRRIALKLLSVREDCGAARLAEARAMARLSHPHVAAIHDVGEFEWAHLGVEPRPAQSGGPRGLYLVLEYVQGDNIATWVARTQPHWRRGLAMLMEIISGLAAAHRHGIVHGDIKPDNVLVDDNGRVKIVDFGLARLTAEDANPVGSREVGGTPRYMAPEQHRSSAANPATDQFSLCTLAIELLGRAPVFPHDSTEALATAKTRGELPPRPRAIPVWLWELLIRGLAPDPGQRFASLDALLAAIEKKSRQRRRFIVGLVLCALGAVGVAGISTLRHATEQRCRRDADRAAQLLSPQRRATLDAAFAGIGTPGALATWERARQHLEHYLESWATARQQQCRSATVDVELGLTPLAHGTLCLERRLDHIKGLLDSLERVDDRRLPGVLAATSSLPPLEPCRLEPSAAFTTRAPLPAPAQSDRALSARIAQVSTLTAMAHHETARELGREVVEQARHLDDPYTISAAERAYGVALSWVEEPDEARAALERAWQAGERANDPELVVRALAELAHVTGIALNQPRAAEHFVELGRALSGRTFVAPDATFELEYQHARVLESAGQFDDAERVFEKVLPLAPRLFGTASLRTSDILNHLGIAADNRDDFARAHELFRQVLDERTRVLGPAHPRTGVALANVAVTRRWIGSLDTAIDELGSAVITMEQGWGPDHRMVTWFRTTYGHMLLDAERNEAALTELQLAYEAASRTLPQGHASRLTAMIARAVSLTANNRAREAESIALEAAQGWAGLGNAARESEALIALANARRDQGDFDAALELYRRALELGASADAPLVTGLAHEEIGRTQLLLGQTDAAETSLAQAIVLHRRAGLSALFFARIDFALARARWGRDPAGAFELATAALATLERQGDVALETRKQLRAWLSARRPPN